MDSFEIENLYKINAINDYQLRNTDDLLKVHSINFKKVDGYNELDDSNKKIYEKFIVNFFNGLGLDSRSEVVPKGIYWVKNMQHRLKEDPEIISGEVILVIKKDGLMKIHRVWMDKDYTECETIELESDTSVYLRFEYEYGIRGDGTPRKEWLRVTKEGESGIKL